MERRSKVVPLGEVVDLLEDGMCVALGGVLHVNRPSTVVREIARRGVGDLTLTSSPGSGWDADLLIALGLVRRAILPMVTFGAIGMAPSFRKAVEEGTLDAPYFDAMSQVAAYLAGALGHEYQFINSIEGTDIVRDDDLFASLSDSNGRSHRVVRALVPDVCYLHVEEADAYGNVRHRKGRVADPLMAMASRQTVVLAERIVDHDEVLARPQATTISGQWVQLVVHAPFGSHPAATADYRADEEHLRMYHKAAQDRRKGEPGAFDRYVAQYVRDPDSPEAYIEALGGHERLEALRW